MGKNIKLTIAYDGTNYSGWQKQPNAPTIQETIEESICQLTGETVELIGSGRTDAGVHALGQVANFHTEATIPADKIKYALNTKLPEDIRIIDSEQVAFDFNSRFSSKRKTYMFQILNKKINDPFINRYAWQIPYKLDVDKMTKAIRDLEGEHDFKAFMASGSEVKSTIREIFSTQIIKEQNIIKIKITGNGFLYNMVRIVVGSLVEIGADNKSREIFKQAMTQLDRNILGITAPAKGLFLEKVEY